jgi:hypothetical protein
VGETLEAVCNMQEKEREELIKVLGLRARGGGNKELVKDVEEKSTIQIVDNTRPILIEEDDTVVDDDDMMMELVNLGLKVEKEHENIMQNDDSPLVEDIKEEYMEEYNEEVKNDSNMIQITI